MTERGVQDVLRIVKERLSVSETQSEPLSRLALEVGSDRLKKHYGARPWAKFVEAHKSELGIDGPNIFLVKPKKMGSTPELAKESEEEVDAKHPVAHFDDTYSGEVDSTAHKNWLIMCNYLQIAVQQIRLSFSRRWERLELGPWSSTKSPEVLKSKFPTILKQFMKDQRTIFLAGDLEKWDISIFFVIFCELDWGTVDNADENQTIRKIKEIRNTIMHVSFIQEKEFEALKYSLKNLLVGLGMPEALFDDVHAITPIATPTADPETVKWCEILKAKGNNFFAKNDYDNAIECYTQAINRGAHLIPEVLSVLYCNRSAALYQGGSLVKAKNDAKEACKLTPNLAKPHFRLGMVYKALEAYRKAVCELEKADVLQPRSKDIARELLDCCHLQGKEDRQEHLDTNYIPSARYQRGVKEAKARRHVLPGLHGDKILNVSLTGNDILDGAMHTRRGLYYASINQMKKSIQELSRAAELGNAEGMYNLGVMYSHGTGCPRDPEMSKYWFSEAIKQPRTQMGHRNVGVAEAYNGLGLYLSEEPNPTKQAQAVEMWEIAAKEGLPVAQNNLGTCYEHGKGYSQDFKKASHYYQLAAQGGDHQAMLNLANLYAQGLNGPIDLKNAVQWAQRAVDCGGKQGLPALLKYKKMQESLKDMPTSIGEEVSSINRILASANPSWISDVKITKEMLQTCDSEYSQKLLEVIRFCEEAKRLFLEGQPEAALRAYAQGLQIPESELVALRMLGPMSVLIQTIPENQKTIDVVLIEFWVILNEKGITGALTYGKQWLLRYPKEPTLLRLVGCMQGFNKEYEKGLQMFWKAKPLCTDNYTKVDLTYQLATMERHLGQWRQSSEHYEEFLAACVQGHRKTPEAYYSLACNAIALKNTKKVSEFYFRGLEVEETLPKVFHSSSSMKQMAAKVAELSKKVEKKERPKIRQTYTTLSQLFEASAEFSFNEITRTQILLSLREGYKHNRDNQFNMLLPNAIPSQRSSDARYADSKIVFLEDLIAYGQDFVHSGTHLDCMVVSLPVQLVAIHMCILDVKGTLMKLAIYNFDEKLRQKLVVGQTLIVPNPYFRLTGSGENNIRVDTPEKLDFGNLWSCCFYCLKPHKSLKVCKGCLQAKYCSVECQLNDWNRLDHKSECKYRRRHI